MVRNNQAQAGLAQGGMMGGQVWWLAAVLAFCFWQPRQVAAQKIAITVDDLPETDDLAPGMTRLSVIKAIIRALQEADAPKVYGFVNAQTLVDEPWMIHVLEAWRAAGFMLGNHTYTHFDTNTQSSTAYERDIALDEPVLRRLMAGEDWHWFRFPYLHEGETPQKRAELRAYLQKNGYRTAQVTIDFHDYAWNEPYVRCETQRNASAIAKLKTMYLADAAEAIRVAQARSQALYGRDINHVMLLHDGAIEAVMLPQLLSLMHRDGFQFVTLDEAQSDPAYSVDPNFPSTDGGTLIEQAMAARGLKDGFLEANPDEKLDGICKVGKRK